MNADLQSLTRDEAQLRRALEAADIVPLGMVLVQLTADEDLLERIRPHVKGPWDFSEKLPPELKHEIRERLVEVLSAHASQPLPPPPSRALLQSMMSASVGEQVSDEYVPMMLEEMGLVAGDPKRITWTGERPREALERFRVIVIGAGMSGLCAGIRLRQAGIGFTVYEKNDTVGGTWYENSYPGCGVDTPNHFYSFSFEPNNEWSHFFSKREALWRYFERCADRHDIRRDIRFNSEVVSTVYDETAALWRVEVREADGTLRRDEANAIICAVGQLNRPQIPEIAGLDRFDGPVFHTARWQHQHEMKGRRVAMIGTGASGMQVAPSIAGEVAKLTIFQRSPHWVVPNPNYHRSVSDEKKWVLQNIPFYRNWYRFQLFWGFADGIHPALQIDPDWPDPEKSLNALNERHRRNMVRHIEREIGEDQELLRKVVPSYPPYGKRILIDNHWYRTLKRDNVALVTEPVERVDSGAVVTRDGTAHEVDLIVLATGFQAGRMLWPMDIRGRDGRALREIWGDDDPRAYLGITVPGFPNFFVLYGPNTNLGHGGSAIFHTECQVRYTMQCIQMLIEGGHASMECRQEVHDTYNEAVDRAHERMVWSHKGMSNWYKNSRGRVITNSPWRLVDYWTMTKRVNANDYLVA